MNKLVISDLDGVIANFYDTAREFCINKFGHGWPDGIAELERHVPYEEWQWLLNNRELFSELDPYPEVVETYKQIRDKGYKIHIITARVVKNDITFRWLLNNKIPFDFFHVYSNEERIKMLAKEVPYIFIDDHFGNIIKSIGYCTYPCLMKRPWNEFTAPGVVYIKNIKELLEIT